MNRTTKRDLVMILATVAAPAVASEQSSWPEGPVRILTPSPPGGSVDLVARLLANGLCRRYGQDWIVENRPGADGVVAAQAFVLSRPGSTLLFSAAGIYMAAPLMFAPLPYDTATELVPIAAPVTDFVGFFVRSDTPATSLGDFLSRAKAMPRQFTWATAPGAYLMLNAFFRANGIDIIYVGYRALTAMLPDVAMGRLDMAYLPLAPSLSMVRDGRLRLLAVSNAERAAAMPDVPTARELGFPTLELESFPGLFGWKGMPMVLRDEIAAYMRDIIAEPAVTERLLAIGLVPRPSTRARFEADLRHVGALYAEAARRYGARPSD
ncbi:Bug family tripartite tricarboxylate transporter substrate binding protein [Neoroseomonas lacus]|uniref:ABC transporter substrate-binding protein n=1 Tax=Neoroseomonas lacus TaxID=287609 RepID=A0A917L448_9PROT|nr:tripartite tricarboxylate transporter substrate binding protein [Neoroseomonas lacus]GGJ43829.1 ABC transporter substrate-binding protein [Neoroseomonas lacus]